MRQLRTAQRGQQSPSPGSSNYRIDSRLISDLETPEEKEEFAQLFRNSVRVRNALLRVLTGEIERGIIEVESGKHLGSPNALEYLTDSLAYRRGLRFALQLLTQEKS